MARTIRLLGRPAIHDEQGRVCRLRGQKAWALLARVVLARAPLDRRGLAAEMFAEADNPLGALRWSLAAIRKALDCPGCLSGDPIVHGMPADIRIDIHGLNDPEFDVGEPGALLEGVEIHGSPEFSTWLLVERERMASAIDARLRDDAMRAITTGSHDRAIRASERLVHRNPFEESSHVLLVTSLVRAGRPEVAANHVAATEELFLRELGGRPSAALRSAARRTVSSAPMGVPRAAFVRSLLESGQAALVAGATQAGVDCLRRAAEDAEGAGDRHLLACALLELGAALVHSVRGHDDEGSVALRRAAELAEQAGYEEVTTVAYRELAYVDAIAGRRPAAAASLLKSLAHATTDEKIGGAHGVRGFNLMDWGRFDEAADAFETALVHARRAGNHQHEIFALGLGARGLLLQGKLDDAETWLNHCLKLVEEQRWIAFRPWPIALVSEVSLQRGQSPAGVRARLEDEFAFSCQLEDPCWEAATGRVIALTHMADGRCELALDWLTDALQRCGRVSDKYAAMEVEILFSQAHLNIQMGRYAEADVIGRALLSLTARAYMDEHLARAMDLVSRTRRPAPRAMASGGRIAARSAAP